MSVKMLDAVFQRVRVDGDEGLILLALADTADDEGGNIYPSIERLTWKCFGDMAKLRTVQRILSDWRTRARLVITGEVLLRFDGIGRIKSRTFRPATEAKGGRGVVTVYRLDLTKFEPKVPWEDFRKGVRLSPFPQRKGCQEKGETVTAVAQKGDRFEAKGCQNWAQKFTGTQPPNGASG
jgi:hypothetical protein